eukprot:gene2732-3029_t
MACDGRDRAAAHAAVRNLAEVYGIDLLPLELKKELITPLKHQGSYCSITRRLSEPANVSDHEVVSTPVNGRDVPSFPLLGQLDEECSTVGSSPATATSASTSRPPSAADFAGQTPCDVLQQMVADGSVACTGGRPQASSAASAAQGHAESSPSDGQGDTAGPGAEQLASTHVVSGDREVDSIAVDELFLSEAEYIEYQMPLEQRITLLEEERDTLVDKLLSTTEALHTLEARNRESQATASQVSALLDQLQELLRRAEAERDRAKLQLRRQRGPKMRSTALLLALFGLVALANALSVTDEVEVSAMGRQLQQHGSNGKPTTTVKVDVVHSGTPAAATTAQPATKTTTTATTTTAATRPAQQANGHPSTKAVKTPVTVSGQSNTTYGVINVAAHNHTGSVTWNLDDSGNLVIRGSGSDGSTLGINISGLRGKGTKAAPAPAPAAQKTQVTVTGSANKNRKMRLA